MNHLNIVIAYISRSLGSMIFMSFALFPLSLATEVKAEEHLYKEYVVFNQSQSNESIASELEGLNSQLVILNKIIQSMTTVPELI